MTALKLTTCTTSPLEGKSAHSLPKTLWLPLLQQALAEDLGSAGDITSQYVFPENQAMTAIFKARTDGVLAGLTIALETFKLLDDNIHIVPLARDGDKITKGQPLARVSGSARTILAGERTALNLLSHLCGIASQTAAMVSKIAHTKAKLLDTRKTLPTLRALQKYAVRCGGGINHRFGLYDSVMLKDNHLAHIKNLPETLQTMRSQLGHSVTIEVEVDTLDQLEQLLDSPINTVLLDNMPPETLKKAVAMARGRFATEASGGITPQTIAAVAESGVDYISSGFLTHSVTQLDIGLDIED